ncbi:tetratricopeptide repeat-containing sensor histidine kinase [Saccharicrinis sp. GN24d3]
MLLNSVYFIGSGAKIDSLKNLLLTEKNDKLRIDLYNVLGDELLLKSHTEALEYYTKQVELAKKINDRAKIVIGLVGICDVHSLLGEYKLAIQSVSEAVGYAGADNGLLADCYGRLAIVYAHMGEMKEALENDNLCIKYNSLTGDSVRIANAYHNMGSHFQMMGNLDSARHHYHRSNKFINDSNSILKAYNTSKLATVYAKNKSYVKSMEAHTAALREYKKRGAKYDIAFEQLCMAMVFNQQKEYHLAKAYIDSSLQLSFQLNNWQLLHRNYHELSDVYLKQDDFKNALKYQLLENTYIDSLKSRNNENAVKAAINKYELDEQKKALNVSETDHKKLNWQRNMLMLVVGVTIILLMLGLFVLFQNHKTHRRNRDLVSQLNSKNQSINRLLTIIGHDLRESLGHLKEFTQHMHMKLLDNNSINDAVVEFIPMVDSAHDLLESVLVWSRNNGEENRAKMEELSARELIESTIKQLSHLAKIKKITFVCDVEDVRFACDKNMVLMILRNIISNAIKFSYPNGHVTIQARLRENIVWFSISDQGVGIAKKDIAKILDEKTNYTTQGTSGEQGPGLGLSMCNAVIKKYKGKLHIESTEGKGSEIAFELPKRVGTE